jgi:predicted metal-dependent hydrolase
MRWAVGYLFDGWNNLRFAAQEMGKAIDRAMDVWDDADGVG